MWDVNCLTMGRTSARCRCSRRRRHRRRRGRSYADQSSGWAAIQACQHQTRLAGRLRTCYKSSGQPPHSRRHRVAQSGTTPSSIDCPQRHGLDVNRCVQQRLRGLRQALLCCPCCKLCCWVPPVRPDVLCPRSALIYPGRDAVSDSVLYLGKPCFSPPADTVLF